jgi:hypothetical protein
VIAAKPNHIKNLNIEFKIIADYNGFWGAPNFKALKPFIVHLELGIGNDELGIGD